MPSTSSKAVLALMVCPLIAAAVISVQVEELAEQRIQYDDNSPKTILELQRFRTTTRVQVRRADGVTGTATLTNLNPEANSWYLLSLDWPGHSGDARYHLENPTPAGAPVRLISGGNRVIEITTPQGAVCRLWSDASNNALGEASRSDLPYAPLCAGALYLRNPVTGHRTSLERVTDFLRDHVWGGDKVIEYVKREFYRDEFLERSTPTDAPSAQPELIPEHLSLDVDSPDRGLIPGAWYPVRNLEGVNVSAITPQNIAPGILMGHERSVNPLSATESAALVYLVSFDLQMFDLHFVLGTDHPRLDWSDRPPPSSQDSRLPGPDGVDTPAPLVTNGMISPADAANTVAAFAGGFKRVHGAFKTGELAARNHGSHYGFVEQGVVFSKLQPGLATVFATNDGKVDLRTWTPADDDLLEHMRYARQNGVPLIEPSAGQGAAGGAGVPGEFVNLWGPGNWSGSANEDLRTLRAGLCLQEREQRRYLIYAYFSAATPSSMARVFQAYNCRYAMHLDMNALEHTYLALYVREGHQLLVEHLVQGMETVDRTSRNQLAPRFLAFPDDRDFFYLTRRETVR